MNISRCRTGLVIEDNDNEFILLIEREGDKFIASSPYDQIGFSADNYEDAIKLYIAKCKRFIEAKLGIQNEKGKGVTK